MRRGKFKNELEGKFFCPECGKVVDKMKNTCTECGTEFEGSFCPSCGQLAKQKNVHCPFCGIEMVSGTLKNKWIAFFLCLYLGILGVHKFYEGKVSMGVLYLFTGGLCGIGWLVDLVVILCKPNPYTV